MFYIDVLVFPIYACRNWTRTKRYIFILVPRGREKIWPCKVGREEKSLKSTGLVNVFMYIIKFLLKYSQSFVFLENIRFP